MQRRGKRLSCLEILTFPSDTLWICKEKLLLVLKTSANISLQSPQNSARLLGQLHYNVMWGTLAQLNFPISIHRERRGCHFYDHHNPGEMTPLPKFKPFSTTTIAAQCRSDVEEPGKLRPRKSILFGFMCSWATFIGINQVLTPTLCPDFLLLDHCSKLLNSELSERFSYDAENGTWSAKLFVTEKHPERWR